MLESRTLAAISQVSYGMYVVNLALLELAWGLGLPRAIHTGGLQTPYKLVITIALMVVSFIIARASFRFVERPMLLHQRAYTRTALKNRAVDCLTVSPDIFHSCPDFASVNATVRGDRIALRSSHD
jgi:peptidoglycan/LPS O-acetylase OafA/YrhL